jgi:hypothetical protein
METGLTSFSSTRTDVRADGNRARHRATGIFRRPAAADGRQSYNSPSISRLIAPRGMCSQVGRLAAS